MQCDECLVDMKVKSVKNNVFLLECQRCKKTVKKTVEEIEKEYKKISMREELK